MSYDSYLASLNPDGYWKLAEASGTVAADSSGNGRNGTYSGSPTLGQTGLIAGDPDTSVLFGNTTSDMVEVPADSTISTAGSWTIMGWVNLPTVSASIVATIAAVSSHSGGPDWELYINNSGFARLDISGSGSTHVQSASTLSDATTYMLAGVFDTSAKTLTLYVNGVLSATVSTGVITLAPAGDPLQIGNQVFEFPIGVVPGRVAQVAFWAQALSAQTILNIYNGGPSAPVVTIGGTQVNAIAGTLSGQQQIGQRGQGSISVWTALGVSWPYGTRIVVQDPNGFTVYTGYVSTDTMYRGPGAKQGVGYLQHDLQLIDNAYRADKRYIVTSSYLDENAGNIFADLVTNYLAAEGVTISGSVGSGSVATGVLVTEKAWVLAKVSEAFDWLAEQSGYWWSIDLNGVAHFQPYNGIAASGSLDGSTMNADDNLKLKRGNDQTVNTQYVKGGYSKTPVRTEYLQGDGHKRAFTLQYEVADLKSVYENSVLKSTGTKGVDSGKDVYFAVGDAVIAQDDSGTVLGTGDTYVVTYTGRFPVIGLAKNPSLIAAQATLEGGGSGIIESATDASQVYDQATATQQAAALLAKYGSDMYVLDYYTLTPGTLAPGQAVSVTLSDFGLSAKTFLVTALEVTDGVDGINFWSHFTLVGSPYSAAQWENFYKRALKQTPDWTSVTNVETVLVVAGALESNAVLSATAQVVAPSGSDVLQANAVLS